MADSTSPDFTILMEKPEGWADRTMLIYAMKGESGFDANIVLARDSQQKNETFEGYVKRQEDTFRKSLPDFRPERSREGLVQDYPAHEFQFTWETPQGRLRQRAIFIAIGRGRIATYAATAAVADFASMEPAFEDAFATLEIEGGEPPADPPQLQG